MADVPSCLIKTLTLQGLCAMRGRKYVGFRGSPKAPIWIVGEAPGFDEDACGYPFVGASGRQLDAEIIEAGIEVGQCAFINPYTTRPPDNDIDRIEENGIPKKVYLDSFFELLDYYRPIFIIPAGATPLAILVPDTASRTGEAPISKWRGSLLCSRLLPWDHYVIPIYHPAFILREYSERSVNVFILGRVLEEFEYWKKNQKLQPLPSRELIYLPSADTAKEYLNDCLSHNGPISVDIETVDRKVPITIGFSYDPSHAISIGLYEYDRRDSVPIWRLMDKILGSSHILGQNYTTFDANWLRAMGFDVSMALVDDTLVRHHVLHPELSHKLDFQVMQYTREPYYKEEGKGWRSKEGLAQLMKYNAKDACCTLEVFQKQEEEFDANPNLRRFYEYEMQLARYLYDVDQRGILVNQTKLKTLRDFVVSELNSICVQVSQALNGKAVVTSAEDAKKISKLLSISPDHILNLASTTQLKDLFETLNIKLKKDRITGKESTSEDALQDAFAKTGNPILKHVLRTRELGKLKGTYIDASLLDGVLYGCASATGTVTGRRASRQNFLGYGSNLQNQPKHSDLGARYLECHVARPGKIFVQCDQASAEEWIVWGIIADVSGNDKGIQGLRESIETGISRHARLASEIFNLPLSQTNDKNCLEYYLGKKVRHAGNYDMRDETMSIQMAAEGFMISRDICATILSKFHEVEPEIRGVFHEYVKQTLIKTRMLSNPLGRQRTFHGLHPSRDNGKVFREGYAYIPQSSVGDNTGFALVHCERTKPGWVIQDKHDALLLEVADTYETVMEARTLLLSAFDRVFRFPNGYEVRIPIDFEIGYDVKNLKKMSNNVEEWSKKYEAIKEGRNAEKVEKAVA